MTAALLLVPGVAHATCLRTTPGEWTVPDAAGDQLQPGDTDIAALNVRLDGACRLTATLDLNGPLDPAAHSAWYDLETDGMTGFDRGAIRIFDPSQVGLGIGSGGGMSYFYDGQLKAVGATGWTGTLDDLEIARPRDITLRAYISEGPPRGGSDVVAPLTLTTGAVTDADVPDNVAAPSLAGPAEEGGSLNCAPGNWHGIKPIDFTFQWVRDGAAIEGATTPLYTTQPSDVGHLLTCRITAGNAAGAAVAASAGVLVTEARAPVVAFVVVRTGRRATVRYRASERARVAFTVRRARTTVGAFARQAHRGFNRIRLRHVTRVGTYVLVARPRDRAGHLGRAARVRFHVS